MGNRPWDQERLEQFRAAMYATVRGLMEATGIDDQAALAFYITAVTAAREAFLDEDRVKAFHEETARGVADLERTFREATADPTAN